MNARERGKIGIPGKFFILLLAVTLIILIVWSIVMQKNIYISTVRYVNNVYKILSCPFGERNILYLNKMLHRPK